MNRPSEKIYERRVRSHATDDGTLAFDAVDYPDLNGGGRVYLTRVGGLTVGRHASPGAAIAHVDRAVALYQATGEIRHEVD